MSAGLWWHVWTGDPAQTMTCGCADPSSFVWYLAWPAYALSHGQSLFFSTRVHAPTGFNLLANTSVLAIGVPLAPVTWLFGPVATLNVALTLAPALSAFSAYACLRYALAVARPAAFVAGLAFGFSPSMLGNESIAHLQLTWLALLPVLFLCAHQLVVGRPAEWWRWGLLLGLTVAVQFFVGLEMLTVALLALAVGLALTLLAALVARREVLRRRLPRAAAGVGLGTAVAGALLAYPAWYALRGPEHLRGPVATILAEPFRDLYLPSGGGVTIFSRAVGYLGAGGSTGAYLGLAACGLVVLGVVLVRRPVAVLSAGMVVLSIWAALGASHAYAVGTGAPGWLPLLWRPLANLALFDNIEPANFAAPATFFLGALVALTLDRLGQLTLAAWPRRGPAGPSYRGPGRAAVPALAAVAVVAALVVPWGRAFPLPFATTTVHLPRWFSSGDLPGPDAVVLFYPYPSSQQDQALLWQARTALPFRLVGGRGLVPDASGSPDTATTPGTAEEDLNALSALVSLLPAPSTPSPATIRAVRRYLSNHQVDEVVVSDRGRNPRFARTWFTDVLGRPPVRQDDVWVWTGVAGHLG